MNTAPITTPEVRLYARAITHLCSHPESTPETLAAFIGVPVDEFRARWKVQLGCDVEKSIEAVRRNMIGAEL